MHRCDHLAIPSLHSFVLIVVGILFHFAKAMHLIGDVIKENSNHLLFHLILAAFCLSLPSSLHYTRSFSNVCFKSQEKAMKMGCELRLLSFSSNSDLAFYTGVTVLQASSTEREDASE